MLQDYDVLNIIQMFNPLYALPIVAVILCAFLVYAFGFKSPVQPPSFDELVEVDRKQTKKRKVKENQKGKQQNGKVPVGVLKTSDNVGTSSKKKSDKLPAKAETKVVTKKNSSAEKKRKNVNQLSSPVIDDGNDEGWVHLVSKKGRKNKKKDDILQRADISQPLMAHSDIPTIETLHHLQNNSNKLEDAIINGSKETVNVVNMKHHAVEKVTDAQTKVNVRQNAPKKQRIRDKNDLVADSGKSTYDTKIDEQGCANGVIHPNGIESESSELESSVTSDHVKAVKEQKQSKKKKKKKHDTEEKDNFDMTSSNIFALDDSMPKSSSNKTAVGSGLPIMNFHEVSVSDITVNEAEELNEKKSFTTEKNESKDVKKNECDGSKGSNVAFDELKGLYPDEKVTKKKRRVRRDL